MSKIMMEETIIVGGLLLISSILDLKYKRISIPVVSAFLGIGIIWRIVFCNISFINLLFGMLLGFLLLFVSKLCKGAVGMGDGFLIIVTGCLLGAKRNLELFFFGLLFAAVISLFLMVIKKVKKNYEIPFIPFLFFAYVGMMLYEI